MKKHLVVSLILALAGSASAQKSGGGKSQETEKPAKAEVPVPASETDFLQKAAAGGKGEVALASLAAKQGESPVVKTLSEKLLKDHAAANNEVVALSRKLGIKLQDAPDEKMQKAFTTLSALSGKEFDAAFLKEVEQCHAQDIALFEAASKISTGEVKAFITKTLPVLHAHAKEIAKAKGGKESSSKAKKKS